MILLIHGFLKEVVMKKFISHDNQNVAWFKLADCIGRGEKERALSLQRLLMHSFDDLPFAKKLEAEILAFFEDDNAIDKYIAAANLYYSAGKIFEAAIIYEKLIASSSDNKDYYQKAADLFKELGYQEKALFYQNKI